MTSGLSLVEFWLRCSLSHLTLGSGLFSNYIYFLGITPCLFSQQNRKSWEPHPHSHFWILYVSLASISTLNPLLFSHIFLLYCFSYEIALPLTMVTHSRSSLISQLFSFASVGAWKKFLIPSTPNICQGKFNWQNSLLFCA